MNINPDRLIAACLFILTVVFSPCAVYALPGDADGSGVLDMDDARIIGRYVVNQVTQIPNPDDADANQDGVINIEDAFVIAQEINGQSIILVIAPNFGHPEELIAGDIIRIDVFARFFPQEITGGSVRIQSAETGFDSGELSLNFDPSGQSLYYHWNTSELEPADDYEVAVTLSDSSTSSASALNAAATTSAEKQCLAVMSTVKLGARIFEQPFLASSIDAHCPAPGLPLVFRRVMPNDHAHYPNQGPFGTGWAHNFDMHLSDLWSLNQGFFYGVPADAQVVTKPVSDGRIAFHGPNGFNRFFTQNPDGTYTSSPGDYGVLTALSDNTFQLKEKNGLVYRFRSDLKIDYMEDLNGNRITGVYNDSERLVEIQHSCGKSFFLSYNEDGVISSLTDHAGRVTTYEYKKQTTGIAAPLVMILSQNLLWKVTNPEGKVTEYGYTPNGQILIQNSRLSSIVYPDGTQTLYEFDDKSRLIRQTGKNTTNPITYTYDSDGTTHITDAAGGKTTIKVNDRAQIVSLTRPEAGNPATSWQMQYDSSANPAVQTDPLGHSYQMTYDSAGNMEKLTDPLGKSYQYAYDLNFNKISQLTDPLGKSTTFTYGSTGNLKTITYPDPTASQLTFAYDTQGNLMSFTDPASKTTQFTTNEQGRVTAITNALDNTTQFAYDSDTGNLKSITDAESHAIVYSRDVMGRLVQRTYPDDSHEDYTYDAAGKVTTITNRRGEQISLTYDSAGRPEWKDYASGRQLHAVYDSRGWLDRVEKVEGSTTTLDTDYDYDLSGRITLARIPQPATGTYDLSYTYDEADNLTSVTYPDGYILNYTYDAANRLKRIADGSDATIVDYEYDAAGKRTGKTLGNGTYATYLYDELDRLTQLINYAPDGTVQSKFTYTYNTGGMVDTMTTLEGVHTYAYDDTYQLTSATYPDGRTVSYTFDKVGNRKTVTDDGTVTNYTTNELNQYTQVGSETITYDTNGNMLTRTANGDTITYTWDEDDRLVAVDRDGGHIDYRYDHLGRLTGKNIGSGWRTFIWDGLDLIAETDTIGNTVKHYIYGSRIDEVTLVTENGTNHWVQQNGLGSSVRTTDDTGIMTNTVAYDLYGGLLSGGLDSVPQRLAGMIWDEDAELYYVRARWSDPILGRFLSIDPYWTPAGKTPYHYCLNSPQTYKDPMGLSRKELERELIRHRVIKYLHKKFNEGKVWGKKGWINQFLTNPWPLPYKHKHIRCSEMADDLANEIGVGWNHWRIKKGWWENSTHYTHFFLVMESIDDGTLLIIDPWNLVDPLTLEGDPIRQKENRDHYTDYSINGGQCPTFIQLPSEIKPIIATPEDYNVSDEKLAVEIMAPIDGALLRSDIPIFGLAGGKSFKSYRVEYGKGYAPQKWQLIEQSIVPQPTNKVGLDEMRLMQGDLDIRGNLATWNSGLKNWIHLPWHPPEDPTDANGVYTIRLVVEGKDGETVEDRVTGEVGRVIAQCLPGIAESSDKRVTMRFPEQSLTHAFRVYTIIPFDELLDDPPGINPGQELIGPVYRIREPGDRFAKDVSLEFTATETELKGKKLKHVGIAQYDVKNEKWHHLPTKYVTKKEGATFITSLSELPASNAIYALINDTGRREQSERNKAKEAKAAALPVSADLAPKGPVVLDTFEKDTGGWKVRDRFVGGGIERHDTASDKGSHVLKVVNENIGGNFSVTVSDQPFDVRAYPLMTFDYKVPQGVKTDFYLKINGRWYNLGFTDDPIDFKYQDVNIANLGRIPDAKADNKWHTASVNLYKLLRGQTRHTIVEEIMMADWNIGGYMKLEFGRNPKGATYYIDNFKISSTGSAGEPASVLDVDNFEDTTSANLLGGESGTFNPPGRQTFTAVAMEKAALQEGMQEKKKNRSGRALLMNYDMTLPGTYGGYWTSVQSADPLNYSTLVFKYNAGSTIPMLNIGLKDLNAAKYEVRITDYISGKDESGWKEVSIPLDEFGNGVNLHAPAVLYFYASFEEKSGKGTVWVDDLRFEEKAVQTKPERWIADFESRIDWKIEQNGAAAISANIMPDVAKSDDKDNHVCRISYGGSIGRDYGMKGGFSYANWKNALGGIDARPYEHLKIKIRGEKGGESPDFYLSDTNKRVCLRASELKPVSKDWQEFELPLSYFKNNGLDVSHLEFLDISFQWAEQSGTVYVDDIRLSQGAEN